MTSYSHVTSPIDALSPVVPIGPHEPLNGLVSEIFSFSIEVADKETDMQTRRLTIRVA